MQTSNVATVVAICAEDRCNNFGKMAAPLHRQRSNVRTYLMVLIVSLIIVSIVASNPGIRAALLSPDAIDVVALAAYTAVGPCRAIKPWHDRLSTPPHAVAL